MPTDNQLPDSDLPYVRALNGPERSNPVVDVDMAPVGGWTDKSITLGAAGEAETLFEAVNDHSVISRPVQNINDEGNLWINFTGGDAVPGAPGSWKIAPGVLMAVASRDQVSVCGDVDGMIVTAAEC